MTEYHKIWIEQCDAARNIREAFGHKKALGYLLGEKFINFLRQADNDDDFARELPNFISEVKNVFQPWEIGEFFQGMPRTGSLAHCCTDDQIEELQRAGALCDNPSYALKELALYNRMKDILLR